MSQGLVAGIISVWIRWDSAMDIIITIFNSWGTKAENGFVFYKIVFICFIIFHTGFNKFIKYRGRRCRIRTRKRFVLKLGKKKIAVRKRNVYRKIGFFWKPSARKRRRFCRVKVKKGRWLARILGKTRRLIRRKGQWFVRRFGRRKRLRRVRFVFSWAGKRRALKVLRRGQMIVRVGKRWASLRSLKSKHIVFHRKKLKLTRAKKNFYFVKSRKGKLSRALRVVRIKKGKHEVMNNFTSYRVLTSRTGPLLE